MSCDRVFANPQGIEQTVNIDRQIKNLRLRPITALSEVEIVSTMPLATRQVVSAQVASSLLADKLPAICGKATLTMVYRESPRKRLA